MKKFKKCAVAITLILAVSISMFGAVGSIGVMKWPDDPKVNFAKWPDDPKFLYAKWPDDPKIIITPQSDITC